MRLISQDSELLVILQVLLDKVTNSLKEKKCLVITPNNLKLPEDSEIRKKKDFSFKAEYPKISDSECLRLLGVLLYHLVSGQSEYNRESYIFDGYRRPLNSSLWPVIAFMLSGEVEKPEQIKELLTSDIKKQAKANERDLDKKKDNNNFQTANLDEMIREVMSENCFLTEEWQAHYGIEIPPVDFPNANVLKELLLSPCSIEGDGKLVKDTHFLLYAPSQSFSLLDWREKHTQNGQPRFWGNYSDRWYNNQNFAKNTKNRYSLYLGYKKVLPDSTNKSYQNQVSLLPEGYEPFLAVELAMFLMCYYKKQQEYLYGGIYSRCQDTASGGGRVYLGDFDSDGLFVSRYSDGDCDSDLGVSALRKLF